MCARWWREVLQEVSGDLPGYIGNARVVSHGPAGLIRTTASTHNEAVCQSREADDAVV